MTEPIVVDVTALPRKESKTRTKLRKGATTSAIVLGALVLSDALLKQLSNRKKVKVVVEDATPES